MRRLMSQLCANKVAQAGAVVQRLLARRIGQVESALDEMEAPRTVKPNEGARIARPGVMRFYDLAQSSWNLALEHGVLRTLVYALARPGYELTAAIQAIASPHWQLD